MMSLKQILATVSLGVLGIGGFGGCAGVKYRSDDKGFYEVRFGEYGCIADTIRADGGEILSLDRYWSSDMDTKEVSLSGKKVTGPKGEVTYRIAECDTHNIYVTLDRHGDSEKYMPFDIKSRVMETYNLLKKCEKLLEDRYERDF